MKEEGAIQKTFFLFHNFLASENKFKIKNLESI